MICNIQRSPGLSLWFLQFSECLCMSMKQDLYIETALELFFYPSNYSPSFTFGSTGWRGLHPTQPHAGELYASAHTMERKKREEVALSIRAGAGKLKKAFSETPPNQDMHPMSQYGITPHLARFTPSTGLILAVRWTEKGSFILRHVHYPASSLTEEEETQSYVPAFKSSEPPMSP